MKRLFLLLFSFLTFYCAYSQNPIPEIQEIINKTSLDSLTKYVRELSGEDSVLINGTNSIIRNRIHNDNDLAADYLKQKLIQFGLDPIEQAFNTSGKNIFAKKTGTIYTNDYYIICAHYDAVADYCADDDASGCAGVLETARILMAYDLPYSIVFAFWDEEEIGINGSNFYAELAKENNKPIMGVLDLEMSGWDGNDDGLFEIHVRNHENSLELANTLTEVVFDYSLNLTPIVENPGTTASDHSAFWNNGFGAVVYSEAFFNNDYNPYYHTNEDRIDKFNMPYFYEMNKLAVGTIATLLSDIGTGVSDEDLSSINIFPNPAFDLINLSVEVETNIIIYDLLAKAVLRTTIDNKNTSIDISHLVDGTYFLNYQSHIKKGTRKLIILR